MTPHRLWRVVLALLLALMLVPPEAEAQEGGDPIEQIIDAMPPQMRVGQLALVAFPGTDAGHESEIAALIADYAIGGVILAPENGNFGPALPAEPTQIISLTQTLQNDAWEASRALMLPTAGGVIPAQSPYVPLFVALRADVDGQPMSTLISGTTPAPTQMALGATWSRPLAEAAGQVMGRELSALGVNLYLGPNLDVLYTPKPGDPADLGVGVFGGDPFWVGELGMAYVRGLHQGSDGHLAVVPAHFPGLGSADRPVAEEVPTVQKSLEQLKQIELAPFFATAADLPGSESVADGFLVTHIRYRGFQGNIRMSTRPISLDPQTLQLALETIKPWREGGGLMIADNLGMPSIRRFDDPTGTSFNVRRIARDAILAGNDLIILDHYANDGRWESHFASVRDTLDFLTQLYESDDTFRSRVDEALHRVLSLKLRLYPRTSLEAVLRPEEEALAALGEGTTVSAQVATSALTRLAPFSDDTLPPPEEGDRIVLFVEESRMALPGLQPYATMVTSDVLHTMLTLYGPQGSGQVSGDALQLYTFAQLKAALDAPEAYPDLFQATRRADWIAFFFTGLEAGRPDSLALKLFLDREADLVSGKLAVIDFGPPYELDSTEVSKLALYYALYGQGGLFLRAGIQALFQDLPAEGASPVSIPALSYDLQTVTMPDPRQTIALSLVDEKGQPMTEDAMAAIRQDDVIRLRTSVIVDHNGHPVPDGTPVEFILTYPQEDRVETLEAETRDGVAATTVTLDRVGQLDITVRSEPVPPRYHLQLTIREGQSVIMIAITPTPEPTAAPTPTPAPKDEPKLPHPLAEPRPRRARMLGWGAGGVGLLLLLLVLGWTGAAQPPPPERRIASIGWALIGGALGYIAILILVRWLRPEWLYRLMGHEWWLGVAAFTVGGVAVWGAGRSGREKDGDGHEEQRRHQQGEMTA